MFREYSIFFKPALRRFFPGGLSPQLLEKKIDQATKELRTKIEDPDQQERVKQLILEITDLWEINNKLIKVREASIYSLRRYVAQKTNRNPREVEELINKLVIQYENSNFCFSGRAYKSLLARIVGRNVSNDEIQEIIARIDKNYRAFKNKIDDNQQ